MLDKIEVSVKNFISKDNSIWVIIAATFLLYFPSIFFDFVNYDDNVYITENPVVKNLSLDGVSKIFTQPFNGHYFPVTLLLHGFEYFIFSGSSSGFHLVSILLHIFNISIFYFFLRELKFSNQIAFLASLLFALHPIQVESVSWLGARNSLLASFFAFSSLLYYAEYINSRRWPKLLFSLFLFVLGCLSKSSVVILPIIFFLLDFYKCRKAYIGLILEKVPFLLISTLFGLIAIRSANLLGSVEDPSNYFSLINQIFAVFYQIGFFLFQLIFPFNLLVRYFNPELSEGMLPPIYYFSLLIIPIMGASYYFSFNKKLNILGWLWFGASVFLILKVFFNTNVIGADRYLYFTLPGLFFILISQIKKIQTIWLTRIVFLLAVVFSVKTYSQQFVWKDSDTFYEYVIKTGYGHSEAHLLFSLYQNKKKNFKVSKEHALLATQLKPLNSLNWNGLGISYYLANRLDSAEAAFINAYELDSINAKSTYYLGYIYGEQGKFEEANKFLLKHLEINPRSEKAYMALGNIEIINKNYRIAADHYSRVIQLNPTSKVALYNRGHCYLLLNEKSKACKDLLDAHNLGMKKADAYLKEYCL
jgi:Flp pilus assembly protein TadD